MNKIYKGDVGTLFIVDCGTDISSATIKKIKFKLPDGSVVDRTGIISGTNFLNYNLVAEDTLISGNVSAQAYIETPAGKWSGETFYFEIYDYYES